ncbi:hypothetical protein [Streptomyces microflavus]|uniref:hypothetical protein n=1 Tax=Streptomyces microflavus TaxID=1919 RepID=UPI0033D3A5C2
MRARRATLSAAAVLATTVVGALGGSMTAAQAAEPAPPSAAVSDDQDVTKDDGVVDAVTDGLHPLEADLFDVDLNAIQAQFSDPPSN